MDSKQSSICIRELGTQACGFYQEGNLAEAERLLLQILSIEPRELAASNLLGIIRARQGKNAEALELIGSGLKINPHDAEALTNYGNVLKSLTRLEEALACFDKALKINPNLAWTHYNRGNTLLSLKRCEDALASYDRALAINPNNAEALNNRANILRSLKRLDEAIASYDKALAINPNNAEALNNRGITLQDLNRTEEALASFNKALAIRPDFADALNNRGKALFECNRIAEGLASFMRFAALGKSIHAARGTELPHKMRHDREQRDYLAGRSDEAGAQLAGAAVRPDPVASDIARQWQTAAPQIVVIDDFLTDVALEQLRRFCLAAPVWRKAYGDGYLGAFPEDGFACPLLGQIAEEMRGAFPAIFRAHPLRYLWGFKYDSEMTGIKVHAD